MNNQRSNITVFAYFMFLGLALSLLAGYRDHTIGADTLNYVLIYSLGDSWAYFFSTRIEAGFLLIVQLFRLLDLNVEIFFTAITIFITLTLYLFFIKTVNYKSALELYLFSSFFFICLYFSSWYFTGVSNGIRQGMALSLLFYALVFYHQKRYILFSVLALLSTLLHMSNALLLPFMLLLNVKFFTLRVSFVMFIFFAVGYALDWNQLYVKALSDLSGIDLYSKIKYYIDDGTGDLPWVGFDIRFFAYNVFWFAVPFVLWQFKLIKLDKNLIFILKIYALLSMFYFIFGFGPYSNRWAYPSWLFIPILQAYLLSSLQFGHAKKRRLTVAIVTTVLFYIALFFYISRYV